MTAPLLLTLASLLPDRALSAAAATQTPSPSDSPQPTPAPSGSPMTVDDVQRSVEQSASTGLDFLTGTGLRVAFIILAAVVITFVARRLIRRFGLRSARLFGKAIPGLGGVLGALSDRRQLRRIAEAATTGFPPVG